MIGCLIYFALYPLTKLCRKISESWRYGHPAFMKGREVWDGAKKPGLTARDGSEAERKVEARSVLETSEVVAEEKREQDQDLNVERLHKDRDELAEHGPDRIPSRGRCVDMAPLLVEKDEVELMIEQEMLSTIGRTEEPLFPANSFTDSEAYYFSVPVQQPYFNTKMWRLWEDLSTSCVQSVAPHAASTVPSPAFEFTIMSYNILAQDLLEANPDLYQHCPVYTLVWENRLCKILKELQTWEPDILCLQEVQEDHFMEQIQPNLIAMGYSCVYKRRTGTKTDGCAACFRSSRFTQLSVSLLEFCRHDCQLLNRDNVGIVVLLQPVQECSEDLKFRPICVATTHLLFNPRRGDVKLAQLAILLAEIDSMVKQCKAKGQECEVILCGDLNTLPNTPLYQFIVDGQLYYHGLPAWMVSGQDDLSYRFHHRRLYAPLWPSRLGINDCCQYSTLSEPQTKASGKLQYDHDFLRELRYCPAACVRPPSLEFIPGVTDNTPNPDGNQKLIPRFGNTLYHGLKLCSVYSPVREGTGQYVVTTQHSQGAAMVDYIFYSKGTDRSGVLKDGLKLLGRLALHSEGELLSMYGLPNDMFPSDHLSLLARFQLC